MYPIRFGWLRGVQVVVVSSTSMKTIALQLASELGCAHVTIETRRFPDTEGYIRVGTDDIESIRNERVIVVSNTFPDSGIVETLLILDCIKDLRNGDLSNYNNIEPQALPRVEEQILLAIPYFGYSRQDKRFKPGEVISARAIGKLLSSKCDGIICLDIHAPKVLEDLDFPIAFTTAMPEMAEHLTTNVQPDFILSPDKGAIDRASMVADIMGCEFSYLEKVRIDARTIRHEAKNLDVGGKKVVIVDDMIATGGTICRAAEALREQGATEVHAACSHGLFTGGAIPRLLRYVDDVHATGSLENARDVIPCGKALARGVRELEQRLGWS